MDSIEFFFNKLQKLNFSEISPTTTVLKYLRSIPGRQGTKEGCAEGDCGACTVVIAGLENGKLVYRAVNSCILFLPALHGKWLITVEDLGTPENLHFIQKSFVENFASQCGFCTSGFEMSLYALLKETQNPTEEQLNEAVEGNLCRCTGYRSIRDAAKSLREVKERDILTQLEPEVIENLKKINYSAPIEIQHKDQLYLIPFTVEQAIQYRVKYPEAIVINGSTDVALRVSKLKHKLKVIIDLEHINSLKYIKTSDQQQIIIGAGTRVQDLKNYTKDKFPEFYELLKNFGAKQIRNRATIGGNLATSSPIGDLIPPLIAMDASIELTGKEGKRTVRAEEFITGYRKNVLKPDEIITKVTIPHSTEYFYRFYKISKRTSLDITTVSLSARLKIENQTISDARLAFGGMAETVRRARKAENFLIGKNIEEKNFIEAGKIASKEFTPISDARADAEARTILSRNLIIKLFADLTNQN